jgi:Ala-tRNA(Pro) deacylase
MGEEESRRLLELFERESVEYRLFEHEPVYTSEQASRVRGVELQSGVKAMLLKTQEGRYVLADIAADRKIDFKVIERNILKSKHVRFATRDEVLEVTRCEPGSVHPIGWLFGVDSYLDTSVLENERVNFNIGMLTRSVQIRRDDLVRVLRPHGTAEFSKKVVSSYSPM